MADGMFDSGSSGDYDSGGGLHGGVFVNLPFSWAMALIVIILVVSFVSSWQDRKALTEERQLDRTIYVETSKANFDQWSEANNFNYMPDSLWFEDGSSHRESNYGNDYHCKGGQFRTYTGETVTFCCSVKVQQNPACLRL